MPPETTVVPADLVVDERSVFLNVPYDTPYAPLFTALIAGLVALGRAPRCALEAQGKTRLEQIYGLIAGSRSSISDLSRVTLSGPFSVPRFNMPFELGIAFALERGSGHRVFVFEEEAHRLQVSLSDMNAFDPQIHGGTEDGIVDCLLDCFGTPSGSPSPAKIRLLSRKVSRVAARAQHERRREDPFTPAIFRALVDAALTYAHRDDLIAP